MSEVVYRTAALSSSKNVQIGSNFRVLKFQKCSQIEDVCWVSQITHTRRYTRKLVRIVAIIKIPVKSLDGAVTFEEALEMIPFDYLFSLSDVAVSTEHFG